MNDRPPVLAEWLLARVLPRDPAGRSVLGDLREEYQRRRSRTGRGNRWWYWRAALSVVAHQTRDRVVGNSKADTGVRSSRKGDAMPLRMIADVRYAIRTLRRSPGFTIAAAITLALGIGATTAIFSVVNGVLLSPLAFADPDRLVGIWHAAPGLGYPQFGASPALYFEYAEQADAFDAVAITAPGQVNLTGDGQPERVRSMNVSANLLSVLGVVPLRGRAFLEGEDRPGGASVALISDRLWRSRFGAAPDVLGRTLQVNGNSREIVGVVPDLRLPTQLVDVWLPLVLDPTTASPGNFGFSVIGRLDPGSMAEEAKLQLDQVLVRMRETYTGDPQFLAFVDAGKLTTIVRSLKEDVVGDLERPLWIVLGTVTFVLLIACANVANLFLVRAETRRREMAVRSALGAARRVLIRQYLTESVVLGAIGGGVGLVLAWVGTPLLLRLAPSDFPRISDVRVDVTVLAFAVMATGISSLLFGLVPAIRNSSPNLLASLKMSGRGSTGAGERNLFRNGLVVVQTALALILLIGSVLLVKSFWALRDVDPGFDGTNVVTFDLTLPASRYADGSDAAAFHDRLLERLRGLPGVLSAAAAANVPFSNSASGTAHQVESNPTEPGVLPPMMWYTTATPGYFETMHIPLVAGRTFEPRDHQQRLRTVVVSESLADRLWPDIEPIGQRIRAAVTADGDTAIQWETVVGVVGSVRDRALREPPTDMIYYPMLGGIMSQARSMGYTIRASNANAVMATVRQTVWEIDPELPITSVGTVADAMANSVVELSFTMIVLVVAAGMSLTLGAIGLYGVLAYLVSQRRQEIGLRIALGARAGTVRAMVVQQGVRVAMVGLGLGLAGAFGLTRFLQGLLFGTAPLDPIAFVTTSVVLLGVILLASYLPARRASAVDPMEAIRTE